MTFQNNNSQQHHSPKPRFYQRIRDLLFINRSTKQIIAKNVFWLGFGQVVGRVFRAGILIYAARVLGSNGYGVFSYALGLAGFFTAFSDIGVSSIVTREAAKNPDKLSEYFSTAFWIKFTLLIFTAGALVFIAPGFSNIEAAKALIPVLALLTFFDGLRDFSLSYFRAQEKMEWDAIVNLILNIAIVALGFVILRLHPTAKALTYTYVLSSGTGTLFAIFFMRKEFLKLISSFRKILLKPIITAALPVAVASFFGVFMLNTDYVILGWMRGAAEIGFYAAAQKIVQFLYLFPALVASGIFPTNSRIIGENNHARIKTVNEKAITLMLLIGLPLAVGGIVLAGPIIAFLYGTAYTPATLALQFLTATIPFVFVGTILGNLLFAYDQQKKTAAYVGIAAAANVILDLLLIPHFGIYGSSAGTLAVQFVYLGFMYHLIQKINRLSVLPHLKKIFIATALMGAAAFLLHLAGLHVILTIGLSALLYFGVLAALREPIFTETQKIIRRVG